MYKDLTRLVDMNTFYDLQEEMHIGIANARSLALEGTWDNQLVDNSVTSVPCNFKLLAHAYQEFLNLPDDSLVKRTGIELAKNEFNVFGIYLKTMMQAYDCYYYFNLIKNGVVNAALKDHFPLLHSWISHTKTNVFLKIKNATIIVCEANGISWEHKKLDAGNEFLYIRHNLQKPTYLWNSTNQSRTYINSQVAYWDITNWEGADRVWEQSYALKIEGEFQEGIRKEINND